MRSDFSLNNDLMNAGVEPILVLSVHSYHDTA